MSFLSLTPKFSERYWYYPSDYRFCLGHPKIVIIVLYFSNKKKLDPREKQCQVRTMISLLDYTSDPLFWYHRLFQLHGSDEKKEGG